MREPASELKGQSASAATRNLVLSVAEALVDEVDAVDVRLDETADHTIVILTVAIRDFGKILGKQGRTARSIRTILQAASMKYQRRFSLDIRSREADRTSSPG